MKKAAAAFIFFMSSLHGVTGAFNYNRGDWVEFTIFRYVTSIAADQKVVYFGTTGGIICYDRIYQKWLDPMTTSDGLPSNYILKLAYDPAFDELWASTRGGVAKYNLTFRQWYQEIYFPNKLVVNDWNPGRFPSLFAPFRYNYQGGSIIDPYFRNYKITVGWRDDQNDLMYAGTWGLGPAIIDTRHLNISILPYGPFNANISHVIEVGQFLWMGTDYTRAERGLTRYDMTLEQWDYYEPGIILDLGDADLSSALAAGKAIWLGTKGGLVRMENDIGFKTYTKFSGIPSENILTLASYGGYIYVGTDNGLGVLPLGGEIPDSAFKTPLDDDLVFANHSINDLLVFKNKLYIAADNGVYRFDADSLKMQELDTPSGDLAAGANDIFCDGQNLYFAVRFGVVIIDISTDISRFATDPQLADKWRINQVYSDSLYLWGATTIGLWRYKKADGTTQLYTVADGLPTNNVNSLVKDGDYLWLGCNQALVRFLWNSPGRGD